MLPKNVCEAITLAMTRPYDRDPAVRATLEAAILAYGEESRREASGLPARWRSQAGAHDAQAADWRARPNLAAAAYLSSARAEVYRRVAYDLECALSSASPSPVEGDGARGRCPVPNCHAGMLRDRSGRDGVSCPVCDGVLTVDGYRALVDAHRAAPSEPESGGTTEPTPNAALNLAHGLEADGRARPAPVTPEDR